MQIDNCKCNLIKEKYCSILYYAVSNNNQSYLDDCPCKNCIVKSVCVEECSKRREYINEYEMTTKIQY